MNDPLDALLSSYSYDFDESLIAQAPIEPRDAARMLVHDRATDALTHSTFADLPRFLAPGDLLVVNETRVIPARLRPRRAAGGGEAEVLLVRPRSSTRWEALVRPGRRLRPGDEVVWEDGTTAVIGERLTDGARLVEFSREVDMEWLERVGSMPLPPYIDREAEASDAEDYQTVYAHVPGSVAAPTAGLHFTPGLLDALDAAGVRRTSLVLHVGPGTFRPVRTESVEEHRMDREFFSVPAEALRAMRETKAAGGRVVAVGTTSVRTLETLAAQGLVSSEEDVSGWTDIFIRPPHTFGLVDALITNFHLPRTTLLMLVSALAGRERTLGVYAEAVRERYRFYSYGDGMLIL